MRGGATDSEASEMTTQGKALIVFVMFISMSVFNDLFSSFFIIGIDIAITEIYAFYILAQEILSVSISLSLSLCLSPHLSITLSLTVLERERVESLRLRRVNNSVILWIKTLIVCHPFSLSLCLSLSFCLSLYL
jgi:hypothetical protein